MSDPALVTLRTIAEAAVPASDDERVSGALLVNESQCADVVIGPDTWRVCFGIELHDGRRYRNVSISHPGRTRLPPKEAVVVIARELGFGDGDKWQLSVQLYPRRGMTAHVMERI